VRALTDVSRRPRKDALEDLATDEPPDPDDESDEHPGRKREPDEDR
jgi:hypothetical protein